MPSLSRVIIVLGALSLLAGLLAILSPFAASIAAATLATLGLLGAGIGKALAAFEVEGWRERAGPLVVAGALMGLGVAVLLRPVSGASALLVLVGVLLLVSGAAKIAWALARRGEALFWPALVSGLLSLLLAWFIFGDLRVGTVNLLGVLLGVELVLNGMVLLVAGATVRRVGRHVRDRIEGRFGGEVIGE